MRAGDRWDKEIREALERMDVFVALVSFEFLASGYVQDVELKRALAREKKNEIEIVPIVLYPMNLEDDCPQLQAFNPLPSWGKCWLDYEQDRIDRYFESYEVVTHDAWKPALFFLGSQFLDVNPAPGVFLANDHDMPSMENAYLNGRYTANQLLQSAAVTTRVA